MKTRNLVRSVLLAAPLISLAPSFAQATLGLEEQRGMIKQREISPRQLTACVDRNTVTYMFLQWGSAPQGSITLPLTDKDGHIVDSFDTDMRTPPPASRDGKMGYARETLTNLCKRDPYFSLQAYWNGVGETGDGAVGKRSLIENETRQHRQTIAFRRLSGDGPFGIAPGKESLIEEATRQRIRELALR